MDLKSSGYKVTLDESYGVEADREAKADKSWYYELVGKGGKIFRYGLDGTLAATLDHQRTGYAWAKEMGYRILQRGDFELTVAFPAKDLKRVAERIGAKKKRVLSPEVRLAASERLKTYRNSKKTSVAPPVRDQG